MRQEIRHLSCAHVAWVAFVGKKDKSLDPMDVAFLSPRAVVPALYGIANLV
jgi:hypothetical protein